MNREQQVYLIKCLDSLEKYLSFTFSDDARARQVMSDAANLRTALMYDHTSHEHLHTEDDRSIATLHLDRELMIIALHMAVKHTPDNPDNRPKIKAWKKAANLLSGGWILKVMQ